jgi:hypothetical protein
MWGALGTILLACTYNLPPQVPRLPIIKIWTGQVHPITLPFILPAWPYPYYIAHIEQYCQLGENTFVPHMV